MIYFLIAEAEAPGFIRFDESLDLDWFEQLGAERMSRSYQRGQLTHIFKTVPGRRNEAMQQHKRCGINAKPFEKRAKKGFKKIS